MKKGFTLIELLAVIVILAIIALIATPIVLNIINEARESSDLRSAEFYMDAVEFGVAQAILKGQNILNGEYDILENGNICLKYKDGNIVCEDEIIIDMSGKKPNGGTITIENGNISDVEIEINENTIVKNDKGELIYKLAPGLYDENDNLIYTWDQLTNREFKSFTWYSGYRGGEVTSAILEVTEGSLSSALELNDDLNYSSDYLKGKLVLDESVTSIAPWAFTYCSNLKEVIIPNSVEKIFNNAFSDCGSLMSVTIGKGVTNIGDNAFSYSPNLKKINYRGTKEMWDSISKFDWDFNSSLDKIINYNYVG